MEKESGLDTIDEVGNDLPRQQTDGGQTPDCDQEMGPGDEPSVVRRVYKIQYSSPIRRSGRKSDKSDKEKIGIDRGSRKMSMKAYDRSTDNDIFALGSAFKSGNFDIDDFLKSWSSAPGTANNTHYTVEKVTKVGDNIVDVRRGSDENSGSAITPRSMITTLVSNSGPTFVTRRKRIITTIAPSGERGDQVISTTTQVLTPDGRLINAEDGVDELSELLKHTEDPDSPIKTRLTRPPPPQPEEPHSQEAEQHGEQDRGIEVELPSIKEEVESNNSEENNVDEEKAFLSDKEVSKSKETIDMESKIDIEPEAHDESSDDEIPIETEVPKPWPFFFKNKKKNGQRKASIPSWAHHGDGGNRGKMGMTASEVMIQGAEQQLQGIQKLIFNYVRMLDTQRDKFLEALFRAVKLNGVDVVKILCQLVQRKNIKLSSPEMREPESSATVLHVALLYDHVQIVEYLVSLGDKDLITATYSFDEYQNQTALHVAVANGNQKLVELLLNALKRRERKEIINTVAHGTYFQKCHVDGQLCLTAAAWAGNADMLITLARYGAHFGLKNLNGDTLLHRLVAASADYPEKMDYQKMLSYTFKAVGEWAKRCRYKTQIEDQKVMEQKQKQLITFQKLLNVQNNDGMTPLALAAFKGSTLLSYMMNLEKIYKIPQTKLGSISWVTYDITDVTSFAQDTYNKFSVLHILAHHSGKLSRHANLDQDPDHSYLDIEPIKSLIEMKWRVYRWIYIIWCLLHSFYILFFTYFTMEVNSCEHRHQLIKVGDKVDEDTEDMNFNFIDDNAALDRNSSSTETLVHHQPIEYSYAAFLIIPVIYVILEFIDLAGHCPYAIFQMRNQSLIEKIIKRTKSEWVITGNGPYRMVMVGFAAFTIAWYGLYVVQHEDQDVALSMALLLGWIFVLFFTRGCRVTSRFSIMIQKMFFRDLMYFMAVYMVIIVGFSVAINAMYSKFHLGQSYIPYIFYYMMNIVTDLDEKQSLAKARDSLFTKMMLIFYAIVAVILLMNMLIAMMNTSYETVRITRCNLWKQQQLSIMLLIERRLSWWRWLGRLSERHVWHKEWEDQLRTYLDVTMTQTKVHTDQKPAEPRQPCTEL